MEHPLFAPFTGRAEEGLVGARFYRYMLLEADGSGAAQGASQVLATYEDGAPAVAVARRGKGRVALFTSTVDRDWSDFAIRTSFLPLMQRFAAYLAGSLEEREEQKVRVGETLALRPEGGQAVSAVKAPDGPRSVPLQGAAGRHGAGGSGGAAGDVLGAGRRTASRCPRWPSRRRWTRPRAT